MFKDNKATTVNTYVLHHGGFDVSILKQVYIFFESVVISPISSHLLVFPHESADVSW